MPRYLYHIDSVRDAAYLALALEKDAAFLRHAARMFLDFTALPKELHEDYFDRLEEQEPLLFRALFSNTTTSAGFIDEALDERALLRSGSPGGLGPTWGPVWTRMEGYDGYIYTRPFNVVGPTGDFHLWRGEVCQAPSFQPGLILPDSYEATKIRVLFDHPGNRFVSFCQEPIDGDPANGWAVTVEGPAANSTKCRALERVAAPRLANAGWSVTITYDPGPNAAHVLHARHSPPVGPSISENR